MPLIRKDPAATPAAVPPPADLLRSGTADQRWSAARALAATPDGTNALADALGEETDPRVREALFTGLMRIGGRESVNVVTRYLRADDANLRTGALDALRAMIAEATPVLPALLADPDPDVRLLACDLARELPSADATTLLCGVLDKETEPNVCSAAVDVLLEIGEPEALPYLKACAGRFAAEAFLSFAVHTAMQRIIDRRSSRHG